MKVKITLKLDSTEVSKASELIAFVRTFSDSTVDITSSETVNSSVGVVQDHSGFHEQCVSLLSALGSPDADENDPAAHKVITELQNKICALLEATPLTPETINDFFSVFVEFAFAVERVQNGLSVLPFISLLPRLPEAYRVEMRTRVIHTVIDKLNQKRPIDANRTEFFAYAEAFAALVKLEFVNIDGAIKSIDMLLRAPETRCAGITMFGKTIEFCLPLITGKCDAVELARLRNALSLVTEDNFQYDVNYIEENMSWPHSLQRPTSAVQQQQFQEHSGVTVSPATSPSVIGGDDHRAGHFVCSGKFSGNKSTVYTLSYDHSTGTLISGSRDGVVQGWDTGGNVIGQTELRNLYACSTDVNPRSHSLYVCVWPPENVPSSSSVPSLMLYNFGASEDGGSDDDGVDVNAFFRCKGALGSDVCHESRVISCVKALVQDSGVHFATGELLTNENCTTVRVYDEEAASFSKLQPLITYKEHRNYVTSLAAHPSSEGLFFSGSYDGTIKLWDIRQAKSAMSMTMLFADSHSQQRTPEKAMITCVHAQGCVLAAGMVDSSVCLWDIRKLDIPQFQMSINNKPVLKVAISPLSSSSSPIIAVSTNSNSGLYMALPAFDKIIASEPVVVPSGDPCIFYDLAWGERDEYGNPILYAAGSELRLYSTQWDS